MGVSPAVAVQSLVGKRVDAAFLFEPYDRIAQLVAPVKQIYEVGQAWPFLHGGDHLRRDAGQAQGRCLEGAGRAEPAIDLLQKQPAQASADRVLLHRRADAQTLTRGELPRETVIAEAISTQVFTPADRQGHAPHAERSPTSCRPRVRSRRATASRMTCPASSICPGKRLASFERFHSVTGARKHLAGALGRIHSALWQAAALALPDFLMPGVLPC